MFNDKLLFLEDLYNFYTSTYKRSTHYSSQKTGKPIIVQTHGKILFDNNDLVSDLDGFFPVHLQACHTDENINGSNIDVSVMNKRLNSIKNRPILAYIHKVITDDNPEGEWNFYGHNMHLDENDELIYDEVPVGVVPESCNAELKYDEEKDKTYVEVDGYLYEDYSRAIEILQREGECPVSVELAIYELNYDAKKKVLNIVDFVFRGVTLLGKTPDNEIVQPGMEGSNIKISDFSIKNNSMFEVTDTDKMIELHNRIQELNDYLYSLGFNNPDIIQEKKGGTIEHMNLFEKLLSKYNVTKDDITFDYESLSDDELISKFKELFESEVTETSNESDESDVNEVSESSENFDEDESETSDVNEDESSESSDNTEDVIINTNESNNDSKEKFVKKFEISHEDIRYALYTLLESYEESDGEWYFITNVFDDYFVYENWDGDKIYRQNYVKDDNDIVSFTDERIQLFKMLLTESEKVELENMRNNYSSILEQLNEYKLNDERDKKLNVLNNADYSKYHDIKEFKTLVDSIDNYSLNEIKEKADAIVGRFTIDSSNEHTVKKIGYAHTNNKPESKKPYGNLFDDEDNEE